MWSWRCFRVKLDRLDCFAPVADPGNRSIIEVPVSNLKIVRQSLFIHRIAMVL